MTTAATSNAAFFTPAAPVHLSAEAKQQWTALYTKALAQAKIDYPENGSAQRTVALKAANTVLSVPAPTSAAAIDALEPWQVLLRSTRVVNGVQIKICVTVDGRKYSFPIVEAPKPAAAPAAVNLQAMNKAEIVSHALEVHGLTLDPSMKKEELIAAIPVTK